MEKKFKDFIEISYEIEKKIYEIFKCKFEEHFYLTEFLNHNL